MPSSVGPATRRQTQRVEGPSNSVLFDFKLCSKGKAITPPSHPSLLFTQHAGRFCPEYHWQPPGPTLTQVQFLSGQNPPLQPPEARKLSDSPRHPCHAFIPAPRRASWHGRAAASSAFARVSFCPLAPLDGPFNLNICQWHAVIMCSITY